MRDTAKWLTAEPLITPRLRLEPLRAEHAEETGPLFDAPELYAFIGGAPLTVAQLRERYIRQSAGHSPDGRQGWLNWMARAGTPGALVGTIQATLTRDVAGGPLTAEVAWMMGLEHQGRGYATEAATAVKEWLEQAGVRRFRAHIHPGHLASQRVARHLGLSPTEVEIGGEVRWVA